MTNQIGELKKERRLVAKLNRLLKRDGSWLVVRTCRRDSRSFDCLGRFYAVNQHHNSIERYGFDPADWISDLESKLQALPKV